MSNRCSVDAKRPESRWRQPAFVRSALFLLMVVLAVVIGLAVALADFL